jgi:large subunit ribosomal protein L30
MALKITLVRSVIGCTDDQRASVRTLGLRKIRDAVVREDKPEVRGLIRKVGHLVTVEEVSR